MRVLFFLQPAFVSREKRASFLSWAKQYAGAVSGSGIPVLFFNPSEDKIARADLIHFFSFSDAETWQSVAKAGNKTVVTPSFDHETDLHTASDSAWIRLLRGFSQWRWPPVDEKSFLQGASHYFTFSDSWRSRVAKSWGVPEAKITVWPSDPAEAAKQAIAVYRALGG